MSPLNFNNNMDQKPKRVLLHDEVYATLRSLITSGQLQPGDRIIELEVARQLNTSQAPVREALRRLQQEGLVISFNHKGTFVATISEDEIWEVYTLRSFLESFAIRQAVVNATPADLDDLDRRIKAMRTAAEAGDQVTLIDHDMHFHERICQLSGHKTLLQIWLIIDAKTRGFISVTNRLFFNQLVEVAESHWPILEAFQRRDPALAEQRIREHMYTVWNRIRSQTGSRQTLPSTVAEVPAFDA